MSRWYSANVLQTDSGSKHLFELQARGERFVAQKKEDFLPSESLPSEVAGKGWRSLFRPKLNVAWLPADKAFLRVIHLPSSDPAELASMVELQLEKLSPLPVTHAVWSFQLLPKLTPEALQTVIVIVAARSIVEEFLGDLESKGFRADRLEVPSLDQLMATKVAEDGIWIYPGSADRPALIAWWQDQILQNLTMLLLPEGPEKARMLMAQIEQISWAGEMEGWVKSTPRVHLVAQGVEAEFWQQALREWSGQAVEVIPSLETSQLAALAAQRASLDDSKSNLLPPEHATRYQQQFVDRLWMRGLFGLLAIYALGVVIYFAALSVLKYQFDREKNQLQSYSLQYTNACRDEARIQILKDRQELKYAALECWKAVAKNMSNSLTLEEIVFQRSKLDLRGTVTLDDQIDVTTFNEALRKEPVFSDISPPTLNSRAGGQSGDWKFTCSLKGGEK